MTPLSNVSQTHDKLQVFLQPQIHCSVLINPSSYHIESHNIPAMSQYSVYLRSMSFGGGLGATAPPPPVGHGLLIHEVSRSHTKRLTTVGRPPLD